MKVTISGSPGSGHKQASVMLANRLGCEYISVSNYLSDMYSGDAAGLFQFKSHTQSNLDDKMNARLIKEMRDTEDFVADALLASEFADKAVSVFLYYDYCDNCNFAEMLHREYVTERKLCSRIMQYEYCDPRNYDIFIDVTSMFVTDVVDTVVDILVSGRRGIFTVAENLLPCNVAANPERTRVHVDDKLFARYIGGMLFVTDDLAQLCGEISNDTILWVDSSIVHESFPYEIKNPMYYSEWFKAIEPQNTHVLVKLMLYWYCKDMSTESYREQFIHLSKNGDVLQTLMNMGYLK